MSLLDRNHISSLSSNTDLKIVSMNLPIETKTSECFTNIDLREVDDIFNPDIEDKILENRTIVKKVFKNLKKIDNFNRSEANDRSMLALKNITSGMKNFFFGENGKITKKVPLLKNYYNIQNEKLFKTKKFKLEPKKPISTFNIPVLNNYYKNSSYMQDIPSDERHDLKKISKGIKNKPIHSLLDLKKNFSSAQNSHRNFSKESKLDSNSLSHGKTFLNSSENSNILINKKISEKSKETIIDSDDEKFRFISPVSNTKRSIIAKNEQDFTNNRLPTSQDNSTVASKLDPNYFHNAIKSLNKKFNNINSKCFKFDKEFSNKIEELKSPLTNKKNKNQEIDKEVIQLLNVQYLKHKQEIKETQTVGLTSIYIKGQIHNIDSTKANMIKLADSFAKMNDITALRLGEKLTNDYESKAFCVSVDQESELKKFYKNEMQIPNTKNKLIENSFKMRKMHYNICQHHNKIKNLIEKFQSKK